jgi:hypothetical protein
VSAHHHRTPRQRTDVYDLQLVAGAVLALALAALAVL